MRVSGLALAALGSGGAWAGSPSAHGRFDSAGLRKALEQIERRSQGRLGVSVLDTGSGQRGGWREQERFPMCSVAKFPLAAAVLARIDAGTLDAKQRVVVRHQDLLPYSPYCEQHVGGQGVEVVALCEAAMTLSDNAAANLLFPMVGGPAGLTLYLRGIGDTQTRSDRNEPMLNTCIPGDARDTSTPDAMTDDLQRIALGQTLQAASRTRMQAWLRGCKTNAARLRAGLPADWQIGSKTGTSSGTPDGRNGTSNDVGILWRADAAPLVVSCFLTGSPQDAPARDQVIARVGRAVADAVQGS
jgi:beta-lactamase class A